MSTLSFHLDHVVIVVLNLKNAVDRFEELGFTVNDGGQNGPTHNALIVFTDGTYIELISTRSRLSRCVFSLFYRSKLLHLLKPFTSPLVLRFTSWLGGSSGIRDWCIRAKQLDKTVNSLRSDNISMSDIKQFKRIKPNSEVAEWFLAAPSDQRLPFLIKDITPVEMRVPKDDSLLHGNECTGIKELVINQNRYTPLLERIAARVNQDGSATRQRPQLAISYLDELDDQLAVRLAKGEGRTCVLQMHDECPQLIPDTPIVGE